MKTHALTLPLMAALALMIACKTSKKNIGSVTSPAPIATAVAPPPATPAVAKPPRPADGIYPPGEAELRSLQMSNTEITLDRLKEGYAIYTTGACIGCHKAMSIYAKNEASWKFIIDDMAPRAKLTAAQKDAVYNYVLAVKAMQVK